jgi:GDPmannose 4,6-dehydratase
MQKIKREMPLKQFWVVQACGLNYPFFVMINQGLSYTLPKSTKLALGNEMKRALITGITGQDGHHLTKLLLNKGYEVHGLINGQRNSRLDEFTTAFPEAKLMNGDLTDFSSLLQVVDKVQPDEVYNLGAISFVGLSFKQPELTANVTGLGTLRILEAIRKIGAEKSTRFYQASSSEMFGKVRETPQTELTPFHPRSPYGVAKTFAHYTCVNYREAYDMHVSCGILFNHEGEYRGHEFVTRKITSNIARIKLGLQDRFSLGDLSPRRDWGYAGDYVYAMWLMLQQESPDDYVISTGETHSVRDFVLTSLIAAGLGGDIEDYVDFDEKMIRPAEVDLLVGDASKARIKLNWSPSVNFNELVNLMIQNDLKLASRR